MGRFLSEVYQARTEEEVRRLYDDWAASYDAEIGAAGYAAPDRVASALVAAGADRGAPVLDFGCGTGVSGEALRAAGFATVDGVDVSAEMLARARAKGLYRRLLVAVAGETPPEIYATVAAVGVIGPGAAPLSVLHALVGALPIGGLLGLSLNDRALVLEDHATAIPALVAAGQVRLAWEEHGPHLPGIGVMSNVYVLEKR